MNKPKQFNWVAGIFLISYQILLLCSLPFYFYFSPPSWGMVTASVVLLYLAGLSITAGYHRLYSHKTYKANNLLEALILFFGAMAVQSSALRWSFDHRLHHAYVDTDEDPYSINKGFWYAHFGWMMEKPLPIDPKVVSDLMKNKLVMFQHKHIKLSMLITNLLAFFLVGFFLNDFLGAFVLAVWTRMFALHHFTWFINSLAHTWGAKPFSREQSAVDNYILCLLTFGEGYHNYHHTFANDYRNGVRWYHFDPSKWLIWGLSKLGWATDLKHMSAYAIKKKMVIEHKNLLMDQIKAYCSTKADELEVQVIEISDRILEKISSFSQMKEQYQRLIHDKSPREMLEARKNEIKALKKSLKEDWRAWTALSESILNQRSLPA